MLWFNWLILNNYGFFVDCQINRGLHENGYQIVDANQTFPKTAKKSQLICKVRIRWIFLFKYSYKINMLKFISTIVHKNSDFLAALTNKCFVQFKIYSIIHSIVIDLPMAFLLFFGTTTLNIFEPNRNQSICKKLWSF